MPAEYLRRWMRDVMANKDWNAQEWATKANTSPTNITRFLKGSDHIPSYSTLVRLADAAGVPIPTPGVTPQDMPSNKLPLIGLKNVFLTTPDGLYRLALRSKEYIVAEYHGARAFAVRLATAYPRLGYAKGDILVIDPDRKPVVGKHVLAMVGKKVIPVIFTVSFDNASVIGSIVELIRSMI